MTLELSTEVDMAGKIGDTVVFSVPQHLSQVQRAALQIKIRTYFPTEKTMVLEGGASVGLLSQHEQLDRIESKLDQLLVALAEEDEDTEDAGESLDGQRIPGERDTSRSL